MLVEIPGEGTREKADELAERLKVALSDMNVRVTRPVRLAELRISGLDDSISRDDVALAIGEVGGTSWLEIKVREIRRTQRGLYVGTLPPGGGHQGGRGWAADGQVIIGTDGASKTPPA